MPSCAATRLANVIASTRCMAACLPILRFSLPAAVPFVLVFAGIVTKGEEGYFGQLMAEETRPGGGVLPPEGRRLQRWLAAVLAAIALGAVAVGVATRGASNASELMRRDQPTLGQMLAESERLQAEGHELPTFEIPVASSAADRTLDAGQRPRATSGKHALDWRGVGHLGKRKHGGPVVAAASEAPRTGSGNYDRVDDPVGDADGWVQMGERAFRVTRSADGALDHLDVPGDARIRPVADGWEVDIPDAHDRDRYNERYMMRKGRRLKRAHFNDKQWAARRLLRKFYSAEVDKRSRRAPAWADTPAEMDRAGWNAGDSKMTVRAGGHDTWRSDANRHATGTRDRYYHWVAADGRTDEAAHVAREAGQGVKRAARKVVDVDTGDDRKPAWLVVRQSAKDGSVKIERDEHGGIKHVVVPVSALVVPTGAGEWKITFPTKAARLHTAAGASAPSASASGTEVSLSPGARTAAAPRGTDAAAAAPVQVWGGWEPRRRPITDVYAPNEDPFWCMDGSESSICGSKRDAIPRGDDEHDYTLGWNGFTKAQRALARETARDSAGERGDLMPRPTRHTPAALPQEASAAEGAPAAGGRDLVPYYQAILHTGRSAAHAEPAAGHARQDAVRMHHAMGQAQSTASTTAGAHEDAATRDGRMAGSGGRSQRPSTGLRVPPLPDEVRAPYDGSRTRVGSPNMRGGMRGEDGALLPYADHVSVRRGFSARGTGWHQDWASDVWARPAPWGSRDVRDSVNRNEEGGAARLVDEGGFHEYEAGNNGFDDARPRDVHDDEDSRTMRVDQVDTVGDAEGRRRAARGGGGNAEEFASSRRSAKADADPATSRFAPEDGYTQHVYMRFHPATAEDAAGGQEYAGWGAERLRESLPGRVKERAAERIARRRAAEAPRAPVVPADERRVREERRRGGEIEARSWGRDRVRRQRRSGAAGRQQRSLGDSRRMRRADRGGGVIFGESGADEALRLRREDDVLEDARRRRARARRRPGVRDADDDWGGMQELSQAPTAAAAEARVNQVAAAHLAAQAAHSARLRVTSAADAHAEARLNAAAAQRLAAHARLAAKHAQQHADATAGEEGGGGADAVSNGVRSWLGVYQGNAASPSGRDAALRVSWSMDAVDRFNRAALDHALDAAHADGGARLTSLEETAALKGLRNPGQLRLERDLSRSASLRSRVDSYLDDYGSGPLDASAANGLNL